MMRCSKARTMVCMGVAALLGAAMLQAQPGQGGATPVQQVRRGVQLVETGQCTLALPLLQNNLARVTDKALRYQGQMAAVRCAMATGEERVAADYLFQMEQEAPGNPEILFVQTHLFSEMAMRAAKELQARHPDSYQAQRLQAESLESAGKNEEAAAIYREILKNHPQVAGLHYDLGQIDLAEAGDAGPTDAAQQEFEKELEVDPTNASAAFILGELARRKEDWSRAVEYFTRATHLDVGFSEAYLALGMSLAGEGKFAEAQPPLEHYVKLEPDDPAGHYQLAVAYARTGNQAAAQREMALQAQAAARNKATDTTQGHAVQP
ncbi:MAG TPA: tetratricopeptide repeat protein [Terracidiphilus sp.]|nr:tetratricopeptide repeat protein [Terracidiphilus sp.]